MRYQKHAVNTHLIAAHTSLTRLTDYFIKDDCCSCLLFQFIVCQQFLSRVCGFPSKGHAWTLFFHPHRRHTTDNLINFFLYFLSAVGTLLTGLNHATSPPPRLLQQQHHRLRPTSLKTTSEVFVLKMPTLITRCPLCGLWCACIYIYV